ncbi:hypothetical protein FQV27_07605 [Paracoccus aurantiacus]|uniref:Uncharacterized protein n=1 Tax=Paracoccus aurantiacus TaxID=2599412 RepID=A0A5C6S7D0_9RHOB|nr:hypothetical protein [Paracoccus aurantiacus]TXB69961.1 hypothetical protein FQV27_07605 [Paracoccus aurantiacus]
MNIQLKPGRVVPQDHIEYLIARYGWAKVTYLLLTYGLRRKRLGLRRHKAATLSPPPSDAYLRRDIGLPHDQPVPRHYWELR